MAQTDPPPTSHEQASANVHRALRDGVRGEGLFKAIYDSYAFDLRAGKSDKLRGLSTRLSHVAGADQRTARAKEKQLPCIAGLLSVVENVASTYGEEKVVAVLENPSVSVKPSSWPWCDIFDYEQMASRRLGELFAEIEWRLGEQRASIGMLEADAWLADVKSKLLRLALGHAEGGILPPLWDDLQQKPSFECGPPRPLSSHEVKYDNQSQKHAPFTKQIVACVKYLACVEGIDWRPPLPPKLYEGVEKWYVEMHGHIVGRHKSDWNGEITLETIRGYVWDHIKKKG